jgi:hypothetical protein
VKVSQYIKGGEINNMEELDKWESVRYRMKDEGIEYCFRHYSSFKHIEDEEFHSIREKLIKLMIEMEEYVDEKINQYNVWTIKSFSGFEGLGYDVKSMYLIENVNGDIRKVNLRDLYDDHLSQLQPHLSDEEDGYEDAWEEYEEYQRNYLIGKKIKEVHNDYYSLLTHS